MSRCVRLWLLAMLLVAMGSRAFAVPTGEIACGETLLRLLASSPEELAFFAHEGEVVSATVVPVLPTPGFEPRWRVADVEGAPVILSNGRHRCSGRCETSPLPDGGSFTLRVADSGLGLGLYIVSLEAVSATANGESNGPPSPTCARVRDGAPDGTRPLGVGETLDGSIDVGGETDTFTLIVDAGEVVTVDLAPTGGGDAFAPAWGAFDATGAPIARADDRTTAAVATPGVVTILVDDAGGAVGTYAVSAGHEHPPTTTTTSSSTTSTTDGESTTTTTTLEPTTTTAETTTTTVVHTTTTRFDTTTTTLAPIFDLDFVIPEPPVGTRPRLGGVLASVGGRVLIGAPHEDVRTPNGVVRDAGAVIWVDVSGPIGSPGFGAFARLTKPGAPASNDGFGAAVAAAGDGLIVGAPGARAAYVFPSLFDATATPIPAPVEEPQDEFGSAVAAAGELVVVGAPGAGGAGVVYVFERATGTPHVVLKVPNLPVGSRFGAVLAATADRVLVGAPDRDDLPGAAFLFDAATGTLLCRFALAAPEPGDGFGTALAFVDADPVVGAPGASGGRGLAVRFDGATCQPIVLDNQPIVLYEPPDDVRGTRFGAALTVLGDELVVGAPAQMAGGVPSGAVYEFTADTGLLLRTIQKSSPAAGDDFGAGLASVAQRLLIGCPGDDAGTTDGGYVYVYEAGVVRAALRERLSADEFGATTAADGNTLLVGAPEGDGGAGFVVRRDAGGGPSETIPAPDADTSEFGASLDARGSSIAIGAPGSLAGLGLVDLYDGAQFQRQFAGPEPRGAGDRFGFAVAQVDGDLLASVPFAGTGDTGFVYRLERTTGKLRVTYGKPVPTAGDFFGAGIAADAGQVLVGAPGDASGGPPTGAAYLFDAATAAMVHAIVNPNDENDFFGASVALGQWIVVGAPGANAGMGAVFVFDRAIGALVRHIENPRGGAMDDFGRSVALLGEQVVVGAPNADDGRADTGMAYLFDGATGALLQTFRDPPQGTLDRFGFSVAASTAGILVGSPGPSRVYFFDPIGPVAALARAVPLAVAPPAQCGNGILEEGEECDDGNTNDVDDCRNDCSLGLCCAIDALAGKCDDRDPCTEDTLGPNGCVYTALTTGGCCATADDCGADQECRLCLGCNIYHWDCCDRGSHCVDPPSNLCSDKTCFDAAYCQCADKLDCGAEEPPVPDVLRAPFGLACDALRLQSIILPDGTPVTKDELVIARHRTRTARKALRKTIRTARALAHQKALSRDCRGQVIAQARVVRKAIPRGKVLRRCLAGG